MADYLFKAQPGFEQTGIALKYYLENKGIECELTDEKGFARNKHKYKVAKELPSGDYINKIFFRNMNKPRTLDIFCYGDFSIEAMFYLRDMPNVHIYSAQRWPLHNFVGITAYDDLPTLANSYQRFFEHDTPIWLRDSLISCGCCSISPTVAKIWRSKPIEELAKEFGLE